MNKDALLATIIGFGVGLIIAALVFLGPSLIKNFPQIKLPNMSGIASMFTQANKPKPTPTPKPGEGLTIQSPLPEAIEPKNETLVSGSAVPESIVVIETGSVETVAVANLQGAYAGKIALTEGKNDILVTSYANGKIQSTTVTVYYTPEDF